MNKRAFTLIELLMIMAIVGILIIAAIPRYFDVRTQAEQAQNN